MNSVYTLRSDPEVRFVWCLTDEKFMNSLRPRIGFVDWKSFDWQSIDWQRAISYAKQSRGLLYRFCREAIKIGKNNLSGSTFQRLNKIVSKGNQDLLRLEKTLVTIKSLWEGRTDYYVVKTRDDRPTGDADVLFPNKGDYELAISLAIREGYKFNREEPFKGWIGVKDGVKIELHNNISWFGIKVFDTDFLVRNPRETKLLNLIFPTLNAQSELALELAHWIIDIQGLGPVGFSNLVSVVERSQSWGDIFHQATRHDWNRELIYHLSILNDLYKHVYDSQLRLPMNLPPRAGMGGKLCFPFWVPMHIKIPFLARKILRDNQGSIQKLSMLQLALRRYAWGRMWACKRSIVSRSNANSR